jgi:hypothetical protein
VKSWLHSRRWPQPKALFLARFVVLLMCTKMRRHQRCPVDASLLLTLMQMRKAGYKWVGAAALATSHHFCFERKAPSVVSSSSVGLVGDAFGASSVTTRSTHAMTSLDASDGVILVIGSDFSVCAFQLLVLWTLVLALRTHMLLAREVTLRSLSLRVPRCPGVWLRLCDSSSTATSSLPRPNPR